MREMVDWLIGSGLTRQRYERLPLGTRLTLAASPFLGWRYGWTVSFPGLVPGVPTVANGRAMIVPGGINLETVCTPFAAWVLIAATEHLTEWTPELYSLLNVENPLDPWSGPRAIELAGVGLQTDGPEEDAWLWGQRWRDDRDTSIDGDPVEGGHGFLGYARDADQIRMLHAYTQPSNVGPTWGEDSWSSMQDRYAAGARCAVLTGP